MNIVLDIILVAIIVISIISAVKKGFFKSLVSLGAIIASIVLISVYAAPLGALINEKALSPLVANAIAKESGAEKEESAESLNDEQIFQSSLLEKLFGEEKVEIGAIVKTDKTVKEFTLELVLNSKLLYNLSVGLAAVLIIIGVKLCALLLNLLFKGFRKGSFVSNVNKGLGFVLGVVNALLLAFVFCLVVNLFSSGYEPKNGGTFKTEVVDETYVYKYAEEYNPIKNILN